MFLKFTLPLEPGRLESGGIEGVFLLDELDVEHDELDLKVFDEEEGFTF